MNKYDVIIAGASFAGLAVASKLDCNMLLIDRKNIGTYQTSACAAPVDLIEGIGCEESIIQNFDLGALHIKDKTTNIPLPKAFCTIDYKKFCEIFNKQNKAEFLKANIKKLFKSTVVTNKGNFKAKCIVDCTGWQAVLASSIKKNFVDKTRLSFGIETVVRYRDDKLHFFINKDKLGNNITWIFPIGKKSRFGMANYNCNKKIVDSLNKFLKGYNLKANRIYGNFIPHCLREPVVNDIFLVGDAAGQTLPLTGEGIRKSIYFGLKCGKIIQKIIDSKISLKKGKQEYKQLALKCDKYYRLLLKAQTKLLNLTNWKLNLIVKLLSIKPITNLAWKKYEAI
jgi:flavin-dependent dehydrogenase